MNHLRRDGAVGGEEAEHGAHVGVDHAAALGNAAHTDSLSAYSGLHRHLFFHRVGGHDGVGRGIAGRLGGLQQRIELRNAVLDHIHLQRLSDDAGGGHQHVAAGAADGLGRRVAHPLRIFLPLGSAGIGVAAVTDNGLGLPVGQMGPAHQDRGGLHHVGGKHPRGRAHHIGYDERDILFLYIMGLDPHVDPGSPEPLCSAYAAGNLFHRLLLYGHKLLHSSPSVSSKPSIKFMFCTAAPLAPLPRLSKRAVMVNASSLPATSRARSLSPALAPP